MEDPLDKVFVDYHKQTIKGKDGAWIIKKIDFEFLCWLNRWADENEHWQCRNENKLTDFGRGYELAVSDVIGKLKADYKRYDKRTKTGYSKDE